MQVDQHWTVKKEIQPALLVVLVGQLIAGIVFATQTYSMVADHERRLTYMETKNRSDDALAQEQRMAIVRLQEVTATLRETIADLRRGAPTR